MVDDGVQQGELGFWQGLGECVGGGVGFLSSGKCVHFGFLAEILEVQLGH